MDMETTNLSDRQQFKLKEFIDFVTMDMYPIVPEFVLPMYGNHFKIRYKKPNQPVNTIAQITLELDMIFENDILVSREIFKKVFHTPTE